MASSTPIPDPAEITTVGGGEGREEAKQQQSMAFSRSRRRALESNQEDHPLLPVAAQSKGSSFQYLFSVPPAFFFLLLLTIWTTSMLLSTSFHICFSSRKLDLYCISGGTGPDHLAAAVRPPPPADPAIARKMEIAEAIKEVEQQVRTLRSIASNTSNNPSTTPKSCDGREVFVYDLPSKFNKELTAQCSNLLPWTDLCDYFANDGMGQPIAKLGRGWYRTHQYSLELIFHSRILKHPCRVHDPDAAKLFYVPFYGGLDILRWHFKNVSTETKDSLGLELVHWLEGRPSWANNSGKDHMFVLGKISWDFRRNEQNLWGSNFLSLDQMKNPYKFLIERQPWELNDIGIPHPTYFHPSSDDDIVQWQERIASSDRRSLVGFAGAARPDATENIRSVLIRQCTLNDKECRFLDCGTGRCSRPEDVIELFVGSEFCLQPPGDSPTRKSVFDSLVSGCIPVLFDPFTAYYQYPWHLPEDHRRYSVFIDQEEVREGRVDVVERLKKVAVEEREEMRRYIVYELVPRLVYGESGSEFSKFRDAFGVVMDSMMDLVKRSKG